MCRPARIGLAEGKIQTAKDYHYAAFIFHYGQEPSDYLYAHVLAVTAVNQGRHEGMWLSAASLDRYLVSMGQPQIFGTQFGALGTWETFRPAPRDEMVFDRGTVSDAIRTMWCIGPQAMHDQISSDMRAGRPFHSNRTCPLPDAQFDPK
ncbi:MAG TPA: hypothetical protein VG498_02340 [Terriglobales bacterium]|nr:hypothetical protein [Terriglobales bacterium]